ncbi:hypothetical protein NEICINOT_04979 [Neisseria cinerea ATCC 14685]|uniref:Uncharacterized protein n=1 Tax=Neisseria cinerea ATCC 14685 TaxID=546262 RepID=D0W5L0_NEICI|nr:hypothetical protein NEICINOT_04979 [Neisseria cinerea ATCC 14685]
MPSEKIRRHPFYWLKRLKTNQSYNSKSAAQTPTKTKQRCTQGKIY